MAQRKLFPETFAAKPGRAPLLPSGPQKPSVTHCRSLNMPTHTLCYEHECRGIDHPRSIAAVKTLNPDAVTCAKCRVIMASTSLYNHLKGSA